tara:strand:+ start:12227 stop:13144 length:918 start_codon:yes stop_codon:yes gene_type:complete
MGKKAKNKQAALSEDMFAATQEQLERYNDEQATQRELLNEQKDKYRQFEFKNPYADMKNQFAGMENFYEDMQVDMRAANFQKEQGQQQRANIMQTLRGSAGSSGVAGLAQAMANQGQLQTQGIAAGISQQERRNNLMSRQGAMTLQQMERQGAGQADMTQRGGEAMLQSAEMGRQSTLLGMEYGGMAGANAGVQSAYANQMAGFGNQASMLNSQVGAFATMTSGLLQGAGSAYAGSDRRLKKNINKIGESPSGLNIYSFEYKDSKYGEGLFQGVISNEVPQKAVSTKDGYDMVDYSMLDVEFKQI